MMADDGIGAARAFWKKQAKALDDVHEIEEEAKRKLSVEMFGPYSYNSLTYGQRKILEAEYAKERERIEKEWKHND